jgi:hypothetical protein
MNIDPMLFNAMPDGHPIYAEQSRRQGLVASALDNRLDKRISFITRNIEL